VKALPTFSPSGAKNRLEFQGNNPKSLFSKSGMTHVCFLSIVSQKCGQSHFGLNIRQPSNTTMPTMMSKKAARHQLIFFIVKSVFTFTMAKVAKSLLTKRNFNPAVFRRPQKRTAGRNLLL